MCLSPSLHPSSPSPLPRSLLFLSGHRAHLRPIIYQLVANSDLVKAKISETVKEQMASSTSSTISTAGGSNDDGHVRAVEQTGSWFYSWEENEECACGGVDW